MPATRGAERRAAVLVAALHAAACGGRLPVGPDPSATAANEGFFEADGARLHYVLAFPNGAGPFPAVVIGHGSGPVTTSDGAAYVPFLLERGFTVLRYDKRGAGQSTGTYRGVSAANSEMQIATLADDMASAVAFLARRPETDARRLGLFGTSQAGWVMVEAAQRSPEVGFVVAVTGSVLPVGRNIAYEDLRGLPIEEAYARLAQYAGPPGYDPALPLASLRAPSLWLFGSEDRLVPTRECVRVLEELRAQGAPVEWLVYQDDIHGLPGVDFWPAVDAFLARHASR